MKMFSFRQTQSEFYLRNALVLEHLKQNAQYVESDSLTVLPHIIESESYNSSGFFAWISVYGIILLLLLTRKLKLMKRLPVVFAVAVVQCLFDVRSWEMFYRDDAVLAGGVFKEMSSFLSIAWANYQVYVKQVAYSVFRQLKVYGKLRVCVYVSSVILAAFLVVHTVVTITTLISNSASKEVTSRTADSIIEVEEDRVMFHDMMIHPITKGRKDPMFMYKLFRYPSEDVRMECRFKALWWSGASPGMRQVVWRRNGLTFPFTDRHSHRVSVREEQENETLFDSAMKEMGFSWYSVNATLDIHLLRVSEFGSYTCHNSKHMNMTRTELLLRAAKILNLTKDTDQSKPTLQSRKDGGEHSSNKNQAVDRKRVFQDEFAQKGEYRLIRMDRRQETIRAPANSILQFTTSYWHLADKEDVEMDYSVNLKPYSTLCPNSFFNGCSKFLLLYWYFGHDRGGRFGIPPLHLFTVWKYPDIPADRYTLVHCLCQKAYGYHNTKYLRRYYNRTSKQQELIEVLHPHILVVIPREQNLLHLFKNRSHGSYTQERQFCEKPPSECASAWDFQTITDFAQMAEEHFELIERLAITLLTIVAAIVVLLADSILTFLGRRIRRLTLEGSMGFLSTAQIAPATHQIDQAGGGQRTKEAVHYDVFLSHSEAEPVVDIINGDVLPFLEGRGLTVCVRDRDLPPNLPEVEGISTAALNSDKFILFLSTSYLEDDFCRDLEAHVVIDVAARRSPGAGQILVVKLDRCESPEVLNIFEVHDWTASNLSREDHLLKLLRWLEPAELKGTVRNKLDGFLLVVPLLMAGTMGLVLGYADLLRFSTK